MLLLEALEVGRRDLVISLAIAGLRHIDHNGWADQPVERNLVDRLMPLGEVDRRIDVRAAVLGGEEAIGRVVIPGWRHAGSVVAKLKAFRCGPVDRLRVVSVREIDDFACRKSDAGRRRVRTCRYERYEG